jgi:polar amino acid transport system substrate-binding protein
MVVALAWMVLPAPMWGPSAAEARDVRLVTLAWPPYYGPELPDDGFGGAITRAAFAHAGHRVSITYVPWARALRDAAEGRYDGILGGYYTQARSRTFRYSEPFAQARGALIARPEVGITAYDSLRDLQPYRIAVGNAFAHTEEFDAAGYLKKVQTNHVEQMIHMLFQGRVEMAAMSVAVFRHQARKLGYTDIERMRILKPLLFRNDLYIMIGKEIDDGESLIADFNRGLAAIRADGTYEAIRARYGQ